MKNPFACSTFVYNLKEQYQLFINFVVFKINCYILLLEKCLQDKISNQLKSDTEPLET